MEAAQLADDLKAQLELAQKKLHDFQDEIVENSVTKEKDMFNFKRAQVRTVFFSFYFTCWVFSELRSDPSCGRVIGLKHVIFYLTAIAQEKRLSLVSSLLCPKACHGA